MRENNNKIIIGLVAIIIIFIGIYLTGQNQLNESVNLLEMKYSFFNIDSISLIPARIDLTITYTVYNPTDIPLSVKVDGEILYEDTVVTPIHVDERVIPALDYSELGIQISLNGTLLQAIGDPENEEGYRLEGVLSASGRYLGLIPVKVSIDLQDILQEQ